MSTYRMTVKDGGFFTVGLEEANIVLLKIKQAGGVDVWALESEEAARALLLVWVTECWHEVEGEAGPISTCANPVETYFGLHESESYHIELEEIVYSLGAVLNRDAY